jgi:hypothetical protein
MTNRGTEAPVIPQLEHALAAAAARRVSPAGLWMRRRGPRLGLVVAATLAVAGTAVAATTGWHPTIGDLANDGPPSISQTPVPPGLRNALGVLRREPTAQDRSAAVEATLRGVSGYHVNELYPDSVRYLAPGAGGAATILAVAHGSETFPGRNAICVYHPIIASPAAGPPSGSPQACFNLREIRAGLAVSTIAGPRLLWTDGLVPDRVASVTVHYAGGLERTVSVRNNFYGTVRKSQGAEEPFVSRVVWHEATGAVVPQPDSQWGPNRPPDPRFGD